MKEKYTKEEAELIEKFIDDYYNPPGGYYIKAFLKENTEPDLLPCPFCGSEATKTNITYNRAGCGNKKCFAHFLTETIETWNTRA